MKDERFKDIKPGQPGNPGAKRHQIDYKTLDSLCAIQCTGEECASVLGIDYETLNTALKRDGNGGFKKYFDLKSCDGKVSLRRRQYSEAVEEGNTTMLIWLGKQWLGQKEHSVVENNNTVGFSDVLMDALKDEKPESDSSSSSETSH